MAHNMTERDGFFTVREAAWHGLGTVLADTPTRAEAQAIAHPWEPVMEPLFRRIVVVEKDGPVERFEEITDFRATVRSDDNAMLGVVQDSYEPVNNTEMYDIAEAIEGEAKGSVLYETGGSLKGGRKVWLLIKLRDSIIVPGDPTGALIPYYALQNAHDGSGAFRGQATMTRIVCDNTAQMADLDAQSRGTEFVFRHTKNVKDRIEEAKIALAGWRESVEAFKRFSEHMMDEPISKKQARWFVEEFVPMPPPHTVSDRVVGNVETARQAVLDILYGETCADISGTAYGLVQASVEYAQHARRSRSGESRFQRAYLDRSVIVADAVTLAERAVQLA